MLWVMVAVGLLFALRIGYECGVRPLKKLKPGEYTVEAVLYEREFTVKMVLGRHIDYGYWEWRIADIPRHRLTSLPVQGDKINVLSRKSKVEKYCVA